MLLYLETNFLVGTAMGHESDAEKLLGLPRPPLRIALPDVCLMEAYSVLEDKKRDRNDFQAQIDRQITQLQRDSSSPHARSLLGTLQQARTDSNELYNDIEIRLHDILAKISGFVFGFQPIEVLPVTPVALARNLNQSDLDEPTDNLILSIFLEHARSDPEPQKFLLTGNSRDFGNPEIKRLLHTVGINFFAKIPAFMGWFESQQPHLS